MRSFFVADISLYSHQRILLPEGVTHHLVRVLRLLPGAEVRLFNESGQIADAVLQEEGYALLGEVRAAVPPSCRIRLIQGLPKGDKIDLILQKGTELGVNQFHLVAMERSLVRLKRASRQQVRWEKVIQEAARQSGQYCLPRLKCSDSLEMALTTDDAELKLLLWEQGEVPLAQVLRVAHYQQISLIVGPEGGISAAEAALAMARGYQAVRAGPRILRTETAGLAIIAVLQYLYGDLSGS